MKYERMMYKLRISDQSIRTKKSGVSSQNHDYRPSKGRGSSSGAAAGTHGHGLPSTVQTTSETHHTEDGAAEIIKMRTGTGYGGESRQWNPYTRLIPAHNGLAERVGRVVLCTGTARGN